jgi:hypothetical protein
MVARDGGDDPDERNHAGARTDKRGLNKIKELDTGNWNLWALQSKATFDDMGLYNVVAGPYPTMARAREVVAATLDSSVDFEAEVTAQWTAACVRYSKDNRTAWRMIVKAIDLDVNIYAGVLRQMTDLEDLPNSAFELWELLRGESKGDNPAGQQSFLAEWARLQNQSFC